MSFNSTTEYVLYFHFHHHLHLHIHLHPSSEVEQLFENAGSLSLSQKNNPDSWDFSKGGSTIKASQPTLKKNPYPFKIPPPPPPQASSSVPALAIPSSLISSILLSKLEFQSIPLLVRQKVVEAFDALESAKPGSTGVLVKELVDRGPGQLR